jgi:hypothetical protein
VCFGFQKHAESVLLGKARIGAEQLLVCFGFENTHEFGCVSDFKNTRICFAHKRGDRSRTDLGVFRTPKTSPESVLLVQGRELEESGVGCVSDFKKPLESVLLVK